MKLCETVLEFHHRPMAMTGIEGTTQITIGCRRDSPIKTASHREWRCSPRDKLCVATVSIQCRYSIAMRLLQRGLQLRNDIVHVVLVAASGIHLADADS